MGQTKGTSLEKETIHDTLIDIKENKEMFSKVEVAKKDDDESNVEVVDLISHKAHDYIFFPLEKSSSLQHETVAEKMWEKYLEKKVEILSYLL